MELEVRAVRRKILTIIECCSDEHEQAEHGGTDERQDILRVVPSEALSGGTGTLEVHRC